MAKQLATLSAQVSSGRGKSIFKPAQTNISKQMDQPKGKEVIQFAKVMSEQQNVSKNMIQNLGMGQDGGNAIKSISADSMKLDATKLVNKIGSEVNIETKGKMGELLAEVNRGQLQMEGIMEMAMSGRRFSPSELLAMQAGVYQIGQEMELSSKVFEQLNNAHKTLWNTNFQG